MPKELNNLSPAPKSTRSNRRRGRGTAAGQGRTAGRGHKGQQSRSGAKRKSWFEGGQMPIHRRLPKRGFKNIWRQEFQVVNLSDIEKIESLTEVTPETLCERGLVRKATEPVKVLGNGEISRALNVNVTAVSASAKEKIEKAGGTVTVPPPPEKRGKYVKKEKRLA